MGVEALIGFGGNVGEVRTCFAEAREALGMHAGNSPGAASLLYRSPPMGPAGQHDYLNAVTSLYTDLQAQELLRLLQAIEADHGRLRTERWGPRTLDLDLLAFGESVSHSPQLTLPHPHMHERIFVLQPLCDIAPQWRHPVIGQTAEELLGDLLAGGHARLPDGRPW